MNERHAIVITSIFGDQPILKIIEEMAESYNWDLVVAGDISSTGFNTPRYMKYLSISEQLDSEYRYSRLAPVRNYCRKNFAYLEAIKRGADIIVETDDDNIPDTTFFQPRVLSKQRKVVDAPGWVNVFKYFTESELIWPRGFNLEKAKDKVIPFDDLRFEIINCPIQSGMVNGDPDVDAIYRLLFPPMFTFEHTQREVALSNRSVCTFNTQNTTFFREAFPLLYQPATPMFREADIVRSLVIQRLLRETDRLILFHGPNVTQQRNEHSLLDDLRQEVRLYAHVSQIQEDLSELKFAGSITQLEKMHMCYEVFIKYGMVDRFEHRLIDAWQEDLSTIT